mgnify:CR=1 FL=1
MRVSIWSNHIKYQLHEGHAPGLMLDTSKLMFVRFDIVSDDFTVLDFKL